MPVPGEVVKISPLVLWEELCSMQGHCLGVSSVLSVSASGIESYHSCN